MNPTGGLVQIVFDFITQEFYRFENLTELNRYAHRSSLAIRSLPTLFHLQRLHTRKHRQSLPHEAGL